MAGHQADQRMELIRQELLQVYSEAVFAADHVAQLLALDLLARVRGFLRDRAAAPPARREGQAS